MELLEIIDDLNMNNKLLRVACMAAADPYSDQEDYQALYDILKEIQGNFSLSIAKLTKLLSEK